MSNTNKHVTYGSCSISKSSISGCRFSIYPMCDDFVDVILNAVKQVDSTKFFSSTDALSTVYRGKRNQVLDGLKACLIYSYKEDVHMVVESTLSCGCPGDSDADVYLSKDDVLQNEEKIKDINFDCIAKMSLYPMGVNDYMRHIANVVNMSIDEGLYDGSGHYATNLKGNVHEIFKYLNMASNYCEANLGHYIIQITISVNSPSLKEKK